MHPEDKLGKLNIFQSTRSVQLVEAQVVSLMCKCVTVREDILIKEDERQRNNRDKWSLITDLKGQISGVSVLQIEYSQYTAPFLRLSISPRISPAGSPFCIDCLVNSP